MEVWKDVVGFEEYFKVSNLGNVYSKRTNKVLKQNILKTGYYAISTRIGGREGKCYCLKLHQFDGDKLNNSVDNLEWCTRSENIRHAIDIGLLKYNHLIGKKSNKRKLSDDEVKLIREMYNPEDVNFSFRSLSRIFNCHHETIRNIVNQVSYNS